MVIEQYYGPGTFLGIFPAFSYLTLRETLIVISIIITFILQKTETLKLAQGYLDSRWQGQNLPMHIHDPFHVSYWLKPLKTLPLFYEEILE